MYVNIRAIAQNVKRKLATSWLKMEQNKLKTGTILDKLLAGGLEKGTITTLYGEATVGKTTFCIQTASHLTNSGKKIFFIETERLTSSADRILQIGDFNYDNIVVCRVRDFDSLCKWVHKLNMIKDDVDLVIVDSLTNLYRVEFDKYRETNDKFAELIFDLKTYAQKYNVPILATSQVSANMEDPDNPKILSRDILGYECKCIVQLKRKRQDKQVRMAIVRKHRSIPQNVRVNYWIHETGIKEQNLYS